MSEKDYEKPYGENDEEAFSSRAGKDAYKNLTSEGADQEIKRDLDKRYGTVGQGLDKIEYDDMNVESYREAKESLENKKNLDDERTRLAQTFANLRKWVNMGILNYNMAASFVADILSDEEDLRQIASNFKAHGMEFPEQEIKNSAWDLQWCSNRRMISKDYTLLKVIKILENRIDEIGDLLEMARVLENHQKKANRKINEENRDGA